MICILHFRSLHEILAKAKIHLSKSGQTADDVTADSAGYRLNSRIVSASLGRGRHIELRTPVRIKLRHLNTNETELNRPVCVFWDYEVHGWSDSGCRLAESNRSFTVCECDHLTNFAVLMKPVNAGNSGTGLLTNVRLDIVAYVVTTVVLVALFIIMIKVSVCLHFAFTTFWGFEKLSLEKSG